MVVGLRGLRGLRGLMKVEVCRKFTVSIPSRYRRTQGKKKDKNRKLRSEDEESTERVTSKSARIIIPN